MMLRVTWVQEHLTRHVTGLVRGTQDPFARPSALQWFTVPKRQEATWGPRG